MSHRIRFSGVRGVLLVALSLTLILLLIPTAAVTAQSSPPGPPARPEATVQVDCDQGETLADALDTRADVLTIQFRGSCAEELVITRDRLTLEGIDASAEIVDDPSTAASAAALLLLGADVVLRDFAIRDAGGRGILARRSSGILAENLSVTGSGSSGITVEESSSVHLTDCIVTDNGFAGVAAWSNSAVVVEGSLDVSRSAQVGVLVSTGSGLQSQGGTGILADDMGFVAVAAQINGSAQAPPVSSSNASIVLFNFGGNWNGSIEADGTNIALFMAFGGFYAGTLDVTATGAGVLADDDSTVLTANGSTIDAPNAAILTNSVMEGNNSVYNGTLVFNFNGQGYFEGSTANGGVVCDPSALVGGSITCPAAAAAAANLRAGAATAPAALVGAQYQPFEKPE